MKYFYCLLMLLCISVGFSQEVRGYYIALGGTRVEGFFKKANYHDVKGLEFKNTEFGTFRKLPLQVISEFGAEGYKFIKAEVDVDVTGGSTALAASSKDPFFEKRTVFMEVLVESNASLYLFQEGSNNRYFFKVNDKGKSIKQLVYKKYNYNTYIVENMLFKQQLAIDVLCPKDNSSKYVKLQYNKSSLIPVFEEYNRCTGFESVVSAEAIEKASSMSYAVIAGAGMSSTIGEVPANFTVKAKGTAYFIGGEATIKIKYSGFSMFGKVQLQRFSGEGTNQHLLGSSYVEKNRMEVNITELNFNVGGRYTFEIAGTERLFLEASLLVAAPISSDVKAEYGTFAPGSNVGTMTNTTLKPKSNFWINVGAGTWITKKLAVGIYCTPRRSLFVVNDFKSTIFVGGLKYTVL